MLGNYFTIDGVSSRTYGLFCKQLPVYPIAMQNYNTITVGGRLENLYQAVRHYNDIQLDIEAVLIGFDIDAIVKWLSTGSKLSFSNQPDKFVMIRQLVAIDQQRVGNGALELKITLKCSPFKYRAANEKLIIYSSPEYFKTIGNIYSEPLITAIGCTYGFTMALNGVTITTTGLTGDIVFDVPNRAVFQFINGVKTVVQEYTSGNIWDLLLVPSETEYNSLVFSGAQSIEITENERWI